MVFLQLFGYGWIMHYYALKQALKGLQGEPTVVTLNSRAAPFQLYRTVMREWKTKRYR